MTLTFWTVTTNFPVKTVLYNSVNYFCLECPLLCNQQKICSDTLYYAAIYTLTALYPVTLASTDDID